MSIVQKLTEGIINRDLSREGAALINKWQSTGLLEGIEEDHLRNGMACLLENQAKELLRESSSMAAGDVDGARRGVDRAIFNDHSACHRPS